MSGPASPEDPAEPDADDLAAPVGPAPAGRRRSSAMPAWRRTQPLGLWWVLPVGLALSLWALLDRSIRAGSYAMAATLLVAAGLRLVLPRGAVGGLFVRSRLWDVVTYVVLAAALVVLSTTLATR